MSSDDYPIVDEDVNIGNFADINTFNLSGVITSVGKIEVTKRNKKFRVITLETNSGYYDSDGRWVQLKHVFSASAWGHVTNHPALKVNHRVWLHGRLTSQEASRENTFFTNLSIERVALLGIEKDEVPF